ncbi:MAG: KamA family radical SAM protein [Verrucomicrobia bacterium]|nr:KamA family radical SAM protein [Verrucomicrobiota bacterium]
MHTSIAAGTQETAAEREQFECLKQFQSAGRGLWSDVPDRDWSSWTWQLRHRITDPAELSARMPALTPEERAGAQLANTRLAMAITPYFFNLVDPADVNCPIRRQVIPRLSETVTAHGEMTDPCGEDSHSPVPGLVHRYPDRVLFLVTDRCATYCRYCTRSRLVSNATGYDFHPDLDRQLDYIARTPAVRDVLLSGGDPLLLRDEKLETLLSRLRAIPHVELIRIGTRIPVFLPQRITPELCAMLRRFHPLFLSIHSNHPRELTVEVRAALERLSDAGIPLGNQSVLLRQVNDDPTVMKAHLHKLLMCRVRPYYLYQCDLIAGSSHLRVRVAKGIEIMNRLRGHTTGYALPQYVIDAPGGGGKVPITSEHVLSRTADRILLRNFEGRIFEYPETPDLAPAAAAPRDAFPPRGFAREALRGPAPVLR